MIVDDSFSRLTTRMIVFRSAVLVITGPIVVRKVCLTGRHLVFAFLRGKSLELTAFLTLLARLPVNYRQLSRTSLAV